MSFLKRIFSKSKKSKQDNPRTKKSKNRSLQHVLPEGWPEPKPTNCTGKIRIDGLLYWGHLTDTHGWTCEPDTHFYFRKLTNDGNAILVTMVFRRPEDDLLHPLFVAYGNPDLEANPDALAKYFPYYQKIFENEPGWGPAAYIGDLSKDELPWDECPRPDPITFVDMFQYDKEKQDLGPEFFAVWQRQPSERVWPGSHSAQTILKSVELANGFETILMNIILNEWLKLDSKQLNPIPEKEIKLLLKGPEQFPVLLSIERETGIHFLTPNTAPAHYKSRIYKLWINLIEDFKKMYKGKFEPIYYTENQDHTPLGYWRKVNSALTEQVYPNFHFGYAANGVSADTTIPPLHFDPMSCGTDEVHARLVRLKGDKPFGELGSNTAPHVHLVGQLYYMFAADREDHFQYLTPSIHAALGNPSNEELLQYAKINLEKIIKEGQLLLGRGVMKETEFGMVICPPEITGTLLLHASYWNNLEEEYQGDIAVCVPNNTSIYFCKWTNHEAREEMLSITKPIADSETREILGIEKSAPIEQLSKAQQIQYTDHLNERLRLYKYLSINSSWEVLEI